MKKWDHVPGEGTLGRTLRILALAFLCSLGTLSGQVFEWTRMGGGHGWKHGTGIAVGGGYVFMVGKYSGGSPPSLSIGTVDLTAQGANDAFIVMYTSSGTVQWVLPIPATTNSSVIIKSVAAASTGNILYVTGELDGTADFGNESVTAHVGSSFLAKYSIPNLGSTTPPQADWVAIAGPETPAGPGTVSSTGVAVDQNGNAYLCGNLKNTVRFYNPGMLQTAANGQPVPSSVISRLFVAKYNPAGNLQNVTTNVGTGTATADAIAVTPGGEAAVTGQYTGVVTFGSNSLPNAYQNIFVARWTNGIFTWAVPVGSSGPAQGKGIAVDNGNIFVTGTFGGTLSFAATSLTTSSSDYFLLKYGPGDVESWATNGHATPGSEASGNGISARNSEICITGGFSGSMTPAGSVTLGSMGAHDVFVARYATDGSLKWAQRAGNIYSAANRNHYNQGIGIAMDAVGDYSYLVGEFGGDARFSFAAPDLSFNHFRNIFAAKISNDGVKVTGRLTNGAVGLQNRVVEIRENSSSALTEYVMTGSGGYYTAYLPAVSIGERTFTVSPVHDLTNWTWTPAGYPITVQNGSTTFIDKNFDVQQSAENVRDLRISMISLSTAYAAPGQPVGYLIEYENVGTVPVNSAAVTMTYDPYLVFSTTASDPPVSNSPPSSYQLVWDLQNPLPALARGRIVVWFTTSDIPPPRNISVQARIAPFDLTPDNITAIIKDVVQPSDPNSKMAMPSGDIGAPLVYNGQQTMTYTVMFYNVGNGPANRIVVEDRLSGAFDVAGTGGNVTLLNWGPVQPTMSFDPPSNTLTFTFNGANLRPIQVDPNAIGFVTFAVPLRTSSSIIPISSEVSNTAEITFYTDQGASLGKMTTNAATNCVAPDFGVQNGIAGQVTSFSTSSNYLPSGLTGIWRWSFGDGTTATGPNPTHTYANPGTYEVTLRIDLATTPLWICDRRYDSVFTVKKIVEILPGTISVPGDEHGDESVTLLVHPSPGTGEFTLALPYPEQTRQLVVADVLGATILRKTIGTGVGSVEIDLTGRPSGIYTATVESDGRIVTRKFVLQR